MVVAGHVRNLLPSRSVLQTRTAQAFQPRQQYLPGITPTSMMKCPRPVLLIAWRDTSLMSSESRITIGMATQSAIVLLLFLCICSSLLINVLHDGLCFDFTNFIYCY